MSRAPSVDRKWLEAIVTWVRDSNAEPLISLIRIGYPKTEDELKLFAPHLRQAKFKDKRGRKRDYAVIGAAGLYDDFRREGLSVDAALDATMKRLLILEHLLCDSPDDAEALGLLPNPDKLRLYVTRSKQPRR